MKFTNRYNLPDSIYRLVTKSDYSLSGAEVSVTGLLKPMRQLFLEREHWDEIEEDISDRLWASYGTLMHRLLEISEEENVLKEKALFVEVQGIKIVGHIDHYHLENKTLSDYKFTSAWKHTFFDDIWEKQLNIYRFLFLSNDYSVNKLQVIALYRDWSISKRNEENYPSSPIEVIDIPIWDIHRVFDFLMARVNDYITVKQKGKLPFCTPEERWQRNTKYAVVQGDNKKARRIFDDYEKAQELASLLKNSRIEERPGICIRCEYYCRVKNFCDQYKHIKEYNDE